MLPYCKPQTLFPSKRQCLLLSTEYVLLLLLAVVVVVVAVHLSPENPTSLSLVPTTPGAIGSGCFNFRHLSLLGSLPDSQPRSLPGSLICIHE